MQHRIAELAQNHGAREATRIAMSEARQAVVEREQEPGPQGFAWDASEFVRAIHR